jgi:hypothetical protein
LNFKTLENKITEQQIAIGVQLTGNVCLWHQSQFMLHAENTIKTVCGNSYHDGGQAREKASRG